MGDIIIKICEQCHERLEEFEEVASLWGEKSDNGGKRFSELSVHKNKCLTASLIKQNESFMRKINDLHKHIEESRNIDDPFR